MARRQPMTAEEKRVLRKKREKRMHDIGVKKARHLSFVPMLLAALFIVVWLKLPSYVTHEFAPIQLDGPSPMSGVAVSAKSNPQQRQGLQLAYAQLTWRDLESEQGVYGFEAFEAENNFAEWRELGVGIIINFCMDVPGDEDHIDLPDWLYEAIDADGEAYEIDGKHGFSPNYANTLLREHHHAAIVALGDRYNADPSIAAVEIGSVGPNGLWNLASAGQEHPAASVMMGYAQEYVNEFPDTPLTCAARYPAFEEMGIGCLNADAGDEAYSWQWLNNNFYGGYDQSIRQEVPATDPETTGGVWAAHIDSGVRLADMDPPTFQGLLQRLREGNASYLYGADITGLDDDRLLTLNNALGYTLWLRRVQLPAHVSANQRLRLNMTWINDGPAAMTSDWPIEIALYKDGERIFGGETMLDVRTLKPGSTECYATIDLPPDIARGDYDVTVAIVNPQTGEPAVPLAMACEFVDGRAIVSRVEVR